MKLLHKCYVCERYVNEEKAQYIGDGLYRHKTCHAGSPRWMKSNRGKGSPYRKYFTTQEDNYEGDKN
jgi:hypothetical protein